MKDQEIRRLVEAGRKNQNQGGQVVSHLNASGLATPTSGDNDAPFIKANPFVTEAASYWLEAVLPDAASAYLDGPIIDVSQWRTLIVYVITSGGMLSLIPRAAPDLQVNTNAVQTFISPDLTPLVPVGVIDPTLTPVTILGDTNYATRVMYQTELRSPTFMGYQATLAFDVSMYSAFNFQAAEVTPGAAPETIFLTYSLSM